MRKIALEEHFLSPGFEDYWLPTMGGVDQKAVSGLFARLQDFGDTRLKAMDSGGIARAVLSISGPGKRPDRYSGFGHLPMQDARAAADELERCVRDLKFCGAMINGHTNGEYLDHPSLHPFWERAEALGATVYIHPTDPVSPSPALAGVDGLRRATWEWGFETGSHALRLVFSGLFDRFPRAKVALGHLGETLPYLLWRFDSRAALYGVKLGKKPSDYIKQNFVVTTSGMSSAEPLNCALAALGNDRVMFAADYPFEQAAEAGEFLDKTPLADPVREGIAFKNAVREFKLPTP
jgi:2,3-dihydroxybenzoate decarboxylase